MKLVGVFVDEAAEKIRLLAEICEFDILQFHGNEPLEFCTQFELPVWRAFRVRDENSLGDLQQFLNLDGIVLDAFKRGAFGGTGQTFDWKLIHRIRDEILDRFMGWVADTGLTPYPEQEEAILLIRMLRIGDQDRVLVVEDCLGLFKRNFMFALVRTVLPAVPLEPQSRHE